MQANHNNHNNTQPSQTTRKSPSQTCVSSRETTNQTNERGRSPNKNNHQRDLPKDTVVWPLHHSQKHAKMNYDPRDSNKTRRPNSLPVNFGMDVPKLYMSTCKHHRHWELQGTPLWPENATSHTPPFGGRRRNTSKLNARHWRQGSIEFDDVNECLSYMSLKRWVVYSGFGVVNVDMFGGNSDDFLHLLSLRQWPATQASRSLEIM